MISKNKAQKIALEYLDKVTKDVQANLGFPLLLDEKTLENDFGWIFFYCSEKFKETKRFRDNYIGGGPVYICKDSGGIRLFGSGEDYNFYIDEFKKNKKISLG